MKRMNQVRNPQDSRISTCLKRSWAFSGSNWLVLVMTWAIVASLTTFILLLGLELHHRKNSHRNFRWEKSGTKTSANPDDSEDESKLCFLGDFRIQICLFLFKTSFWVFFRLTCWNFSQTVSVYTVYLDFLSLSQVAAPSIGTPGTLGVDSFWMCQNEDHGFCSSMVAFMGISVCWWKRRLSSEGLCELQKHPKRLPLGYGFDTLGIWIIFFLAYEFIWYHITPWSLLTDVDSCFAPGTTTKWFLRFAIAIEALFFSQLTRGEWYFDVTSNDFKWWC